MRFDSPKSYFRNQNETLFHVERKIYRGQKRRKNETNIKIQN